MEVAAYPKSRKVRYTNSVIGVPVEGRLVQSAVLWHSSYFKNVILIAPTDLRLDPHADSMDLGEPLGLFFTAAQCIRAGHWKFQGMTEFDVPSEVITFQSAQTIYCGDEPLREKTSDDEVMTLLAFGCGAIDIAFKELLAGNYDNRNHRIAQRIIAKNLRGLTSRG